MSAWPGVTVRLAALLFAWALAAGAQAQATDEARGPAEIRDEHLLAQPRLTLPPVSPATTPAGHWSFEVGVLWSNSFAWEQNVPGEHPAMRNFLIDGEAHTLDLTLRRGLRPDLDLSLRVPLRWRGGGVMDGLIDWWHRTLSLPDGGRPLFPTNAFQVDGTRNDGGGRFSWDDQAGTGLGDLELASRWRFAGQASGGSAALVARVSAPTGTGPFAGNGPAGGLQLVGRRPLGRRVDVYAGLGGTVQPRGPVRGIAYEPARLHGFLAFEWRPWDRFSLVAETNAASRLVANILDYPGIHWLLDVSGRLQLGRRTRLDLGFTENFKDQLSTVDFAVYAGIGFRR